jgi:hypothetical protein
MSGADIAAEVSAAMAEAGSAVGNGPLRSTLRKRIGPDVPWTGTALAATDAQIVVVQTRRNERDGQGMIVRTSRMLLIDPTGPVPAKGDQVAVGVLPAAVTDATVWLRLGDIETPGGVPVLYKAMLEG